MNGMRVRDCLTAALALCVFLFLPSCVAQAEKAETVFSVSVAEAGTYALRVTYAPQKENVRDVAASIRVNGEIQQPSHEKTVLYAIWRDETQTYAVNAYGNDLYPRPVFCFEEQTALLYESEYCADEPLAFALRAGVNEVCLTVERGAVEIRAVRAEPLAPAPDTDAYLAVLPAARAALDAPIVIEGEHYAFKTLSSIRAGRSRSAQMHPFDAAHTRVNALDGATWAEPGDAVSYSFNVPVNGCYYIGVRYLQQDKKDIPVFKTVRVDGETPCAALAAYGFAYTGSRVAVNVLSFSGEAIPVFLTAGRHTLTFVSTASPCAEAHRRLKRLTSDMNGLALDIRKISANKVDKNRDWQLAYYLPDIRERLTKLTEDIDVVHALIEGGRLGGDAGMLSDLRVARAQIVRYLTDKDGLNDLVNGLSSFAQASGSLAESIAYLPAELLLQPLTIDRVYVLSDPATLPRDDRGVIDGLWQELRKTALSFFVESDGAQSTKSDALNVWMIGSAQQLETLREMTDAAFPDRDIHISLVTSESKVQLAVSAGNAPDVVLGASMPFAYQLGIRGAVMDLTAFDDYESVTRRFYEESLLPAAMNGSQYALPQTLELWMLFYRADILEALGLTAPDTWDDVIAMLPALYRYGMDFNTVIAYGGALKTLTATMPLMLEHGAKLYRPDGLSVDFSSPEFMRGFTLLTELYTKYGIGTGISNFFSSFRNGTVPIGVSGLGTYVLLREAADELAGAWGVAPLPGVAAADGVNRAHPAVSGGCMIMLDTDKADEAWGFLKWWTDKQAQNDFASRLLTTYGGEYLWVTANREALIESALLPEDDQAVMLTQLASMRENPSHPASMLVERALSNAWNEVVFSGKDVRSALDSAQIEADRGIRRKLMQFGYIDDAGVAVAPLWEADSHE